MTHKMMTRAGAALALMALVAAGPTTAAAGERRGLRGERRAAVVRSGEAGLFAEAWRWLVSVWGKEGSMIDPNGVKPPSPPPPNPLTVPAPPPSTS